MTQSGYRTHMHRRSAVLLTLAACAALCTAANARDAGANTKAAALATKNAKAVTYKLLQRSSGANIGTVTLQVIGRTRTRIRVQLSNPAVVEPRVTLRSGRDCNEPRIAQAPRSPILLNPFTGRTSTTIVNLPLTNLSSGNYLIDVRTATQRAQALDACVKLQ